VAWEDFLQCSVAALGRPLMEEAYLHTIEKHKQGAVGKRGVDAIAQAFGTLVHEMTKTDEDILGDIHQGIALPEHQQYMTPAPIAEMMARLSLPEEPTDLAGRRSVSDCACGSGRLLLAAARIQPNWHFVGQDLDRRCVFMASLNLGLRNHYGHIVWGNTLTNEAKLIYETGRVQIWGNAIRQVSSVPLPDREPDVIDIPETDAGSSQSSPNDATPEQPTGAEPVPSNDPQSGRHQLKLF